MRKTMLPKIKMRENELGFSLLEGMVSLSLMSLIVLMTLETFHAGTRMHDVTYNQSRLAGEARLAIERMTRELRNSNLARIVIPQANVLQFQIPSSIDASGNITWSGWFQYALGGVNGEQLIRQNVVSGAWTALANKVTAVQFVQNQNPATVTMTLTAQDATDYGTVMPVSLSGSVELRN